VLNDLKDWGGDLENDRRVAGDLLGGRPTLLWALAMERLDARDAIRLKEIAAAARRADRPLDTMTLVTEARSLYERAGVVERARSVASNQRASALQALNDCRLPRLRDVLEFLLDLAVPEAAIGP
jgi:geranylgeranyl pyrophosphate synthase